MFLDERPELPWREEERPEVGRGRDRGRANAFVDERDLPEVVARAERRKRLAADPHVRVPLGDHEEARSRRAFLDDDRALAEGALLKAVGEPLERAPVELGEKRDVLENLDRRAHSGAG